MSETCADTGLVWEVGVGGEGRRLQIIGIASYSARVTTYLRGPLGLALLTPTGQKRPSGLQIEEGEEVI